MHTLALVLLLQVSPSPVASEPLPRRAGSHGEMGLGAGTMWTRAANDWVSLTGVTARCQFSYRLLLGSQLRLGPMLAGSVTLGQGHAATLTLAPELELEMPGGASLVLSFGPTLAASSSLYLGPETTLAILQHWQRPKADSRIGFAFLRAVFAPLFALSGPDPGPGGLAQLTLGFTAGAP